jgi:hypothetical protein
VDDGETAHGTTFWAEDILATSRAGHRCRFWSGATLRSS